MNSHAASQTSLESRTLSRGQRLLLTLVLALLLWLPRGLALDHFVAVDERSWITRSGNFYLALATGDFNSTYQYYHPGVTTMWIGALAYLWQFPDYPADVAADPSIEGSGQIRSMSEGIEDRLVAYGHSPLRILAAARTIMVTLIVLLLLAAFWIAVDLLGLVPALVGVLLLGFDPMTLGLTRMLHVDGLSSTLMLLSVLAWMRFCAPNNERAGAWRDVGLSGVAAGLAWLTKSPALVLGPVALLVVALYWWRMRNRAAFCVGVRALLMWGVLAAAIFVLCWPAMWTRPLANIQQILGAAEEYAEESNQQIFFNGEIITDDPGPLFYPITYLWHVTPVTLVGLALALVAGVVNWRARSSWWKSQGQNDAMLVLYALIFTLLMTFGSKKIDRYLLPAYLPLALVAGVGWVALAQWIAARFASRRFQWAYSLPALVFVAQAALALPHFPYYFTFYNPLLGGNRSALDVLMIGLGEGIDEAARYLNSKPDAETLRVASWYRGGSFNYIFRGQDLNLDEFSEADYAVLYVHQWQRQVPDARMLHYFDQLTPERTVTLHGMEYVRVYDLRSAPTPPYFTDWANAIRLVQTDLPVAPLQPGERFLANFHLRTIGTLETNLVAIVRLMDAAGSEVARSEAWPFGAATSTWQTGETYVDGHELALPANVAPGYLRVELGFFDGETQALVPSYVAGTETPRGEFVAAGYVGVGLTGRQPARLDDAPVLGEQIRLMGARLQGEDLRDGKAIALTYPANVPVLPLMLAWQATRPLDKDYIALVHLIAPDGTLAKQFDRAPLQGVVPLTLWRTGDPLLDAYDLEIPPDLPPGDYRLLVGLYDLPTLTRLPVAIRGEAAGDTVHIATLTIP